MGVVRSVCVFCGSKVGRNPEYHSAARQFGEILGNARVRLVFGGGSIGLMGVVADAALAAGGKVHGVIPAFLDRIEVAHRNLTHLDVVDSMHERKRRMFELADAFVTLPGGLGTLDETIEIVTWRQLGLHDKPIVLLDVQGYWHPLLALFDQAIGQSFAGEGTRRLFTVVEDAREVLPVLEAEAKAATGTSVPAKVL